MSAPRASQIGQPFNPWKRFNGVFVPLGLLTYPELSDRAKLFYGRLCYSAGKDAVLPWTRPELGVVGDDNMDNSI